MGHTGRVPRAVEAGSGHGDTVNFLDRPIASPPTAVDKQTALGTRIEPEAGFLETWRDRYGADRPDPWIQLKAAIFIVLALAVWSFYVIVVRVCTPVIRNTSSSGLGRATGAGTLVGFVILWLMFVWSYLKMILTGPGFARDHLPRTAQRPSHGPFIPPAAVPGSQSGSSFHHHHRILPSDINNDRTADPAGPDPSEFAPVSNLMNTFQSSDFRPSSPATTDTLEADRKKRRAKDWRELERPMPPVQIGLRWCRFCEVNKPDRTHHCRHCGTCVLQFDHHCLWVGQCVGWANHKFFINFNTWAMLFTAYVLVFLIVVITRSSDIDGQVIGLIAVSAMFCLFTTMMLSSHIYLILTGQSTVESFSARDQARREADLLQREYGYLWHNMEKRKVNRKWKEEWGGLPVDARWKFGSSRQMWEQEMGRSPLGWILPLGKPLGNGIQFPSNPRFGPNGEWLKRKDWPKDLG